MRTLEMLWDSMRHAMNLQWRFPASKRWPWALAFVVFLVYLPSLSGGFLNWDDPWLVEQNEYLTERGVAALGGILFDLSRPTRLALGAEYLPIRDLTVWLELQLYGAEPHAMRALNLALYITAALLFREVFRRALGRGWAAELAAWTFALHPIHVESVAWIAGRKDVLMLVGVAGALLVHDSRSRFRYLALPCLVAAACLSKSAAVILPGLLFTQDLLGRRRLDWLGYAVGFLAALVVLSIQIQVGQIVGMTTPPPGGSRWTALMTMGPVWLRYGWAALWPGALSIIHDVPTLVRWTPASVLGYLLQASWLVLATWQWLRHDQRLGVAAWLWWIVPLLPVCQVVVSLQNRMADRYLLLSVFAVALGVAWLAAAGRIGVLIAAVSVLLWAGATAFRADLFADSVRLFREATEKTSLSTMAPYVWGRGLDERGDGLGAEAAYREVLRRMKAPDEPGRRATNNLARLAVRRAKLAEAYELLDRGSRLWPNDPKVELNLVKVLYRLGRVEEAERRYIELKKRIPDAEERARRSFFLGEEGPGTESPR